MPEKYDEIKNQLFVNIQCWSFGFALFKCKLKMFDFTKPNINYFNYCDIPKENKSTLLKTMLFLKWSRTRINDIFEHFFSVLKLFMNILKSSRPQELLFMVPTLRLLLVAIIDTQFLGSVVHHLGYYVMLNANNYGMSS